MRRTRQVGRIARGLVEVVCGYPCVRLPMPMSQNMRKRACAVRLIQSRRGRDRKRSPAWGAAHRCRVPRHRQSALILAPARSACRSRYHAASRAPFSDQRRDDQRRQGQCPASSTPASMRAHSALPSHRRSVIDRQHAPNIAWRGRRARANPHPFALPAVACAAASGFPLARQPYPPCA